MNLKDEIYGLNISITKELTQLKEEVSKLKNNLYFTKEKPRNKMKTCKNREQKLQMKQR